MRTAIADEADAPLTVAEAGEAPTTPARAVAHSYHRTVIVSLSVYAVASTACAAWFASSRTGGGPVAMVEEGRPSSKATKMLGGAFWQTPPMKRMGCTNWEELLLSPSGIGFITSTAGNCGELCNSNPLCASFNFQPDECFGPQQSGPGSCFLFKAGCQMQENDCWDLYTIRRGNTGACRDTMMSTDPSTGAQVSDKTLAKDLGPLGGLLGKWSNAPGWTPGDPAPAVVGLNVIMHNLFVDGGVPNIPAQTAGFELLEHKYVETLEITPIIGAVRNRGYQDANHFNPECQLDQFVMGLNYHQVVREILNGSVIHDEVGQWLFNEDPGVDNGWTVARLAVIPHGQSVQALGLNSTVVGTQAIKDSILATMEDSTGPQFIHFPINTGLDPAPPDSGYAAVDPPFDSVESLLAEVPNAPDVTATQLDITTSAARGPPGGSIGQMPNPKSQAFTEQFNFTFWIEEFTEPGSGVKTTQLQYLQTMFISFMAKLGDPACQSAYPGLDEPLCLIKWPHFQMNTMVKVEDYPFTPSSMNVCGIDDKLPPIR